MADPALQDELIIETLINNRTLYIDIDYLNVTDQTLQVDDLNVTQANGEALPSCVKF